MQYRAIALRLQRWWGNKEPLRFMRIDIIDAKMSWWSVICWIHQAIFDEEELKISVERPWVFGVLDWKQFEHSKVDSTSQGTEGTLCSYDTDPMEASTSSLELDLYIPSSVKWRLTRTQQRANQNLFCSVLRQTKRLQLLFRQETEFRSRV